MEVQHDEVSCEIWLVDAAYLHKLTWSRVVTKKYKVDIIVD